jgi:hypothetical protein
MVSRAAPEAFDIRDDVEGVFVPRLNFEGVVAEWRLDPQETLAS